MMLAVSDGWALHDGDMSYHPLSGLALCRLRGAADRSSAVRQLQACKVCIDHIRQGVAASSAVARDLPGLCPVKLRRPDHCG